MKTTHIDIIIIGAGLSGICAGHYVQTECPDKTFAILEGRASLRGTWDLFRYPGIRSDSDMHTLGFSFRPWPNPQALADGPSILRYLNDTVEACGLDSKIHYCQGVVTVSWSSEHARWTVTSQNTDTGEESVRTCNFVWFCTGYYRYEHGYMPDFKGADQFGGQLIHPQRWPGDVEFDQKRVVVIGSGATAVTLIPAMAARTAHITFQPDLRPLGSARVLRARRRPVRRAAPRRGLSRHRPYRPLHSDRDRASLRPGSRFAPASTWTPISSSAPRDSTSRSPAARASRSTAKPSTPANTPCIWERCSAGYPTP